MDNKWPGGRRHAMTQSQHEQWNATSYPGTRQLCDECGEPTGRCEEDSFIAHDGSVYCEQCAECETCEGTGTIDLTLGGWSTDNPAAECPDCQGTGVWISDIWAKGYNA